MASFFLSTIHPTHRAIATTVTTAPPLPPPLPHPPTSFQLEDEAPPVQFPAHADAIAPRSLKIFVCVVVVAVMAVVAGHTPRTTGFTRLRAYMCGCNVLLPGAIGHNTAIADHILTILQIAKDGPRPPHSPQSPGRFFRSRNHFPTGRMGAAGRKGEQFLMALLLRPFNTSTLPLLRSRCDQKRQGISDCYNAGSPLLDGFLQPPRITLMVATGCSCVIALPTRYTLPWERCVASVAEEYISQQSAGVVW